MVRLGVLSFSDGRERVHKSLEPDIRQHEVRIKSILEKTGELEIVLAPEIIYSAELARQQARYLTTFQVDGIILNMAVFAFPNYVVLAAQENPCPYLLLGPQDSRYPGLGGLLAAGGALTQIGIRHERLWVDLDDANFTKHVLIFARTAAAVHRLRGQVFGLIGGRSIGMVTGAAPGELWTRIFGVDIDHADQSEILRISKKIPEADVIKARNWLENNVKEIIYDGIQLTQEKLEFELRCAIALKEIVHKQQFDFIGLKCHFDLSEYYCVQCLSATFLNDPYDWDGAKQPIQLACEADADGALTMQVLYLISNKPSCLLDWRFYDSEKSVYALPNCGAAPTWFAARSETPQENLANVRIVPAINKYAGGGAHVEFVFGAGEVTLARLSRSPEGYQMFITRGNVQEYHINDVKGANPHWPHAFVSLPIAPNELIPILQANHIHFVAGDYQAELEMFCRFLDIKPVIV
jgi:L-fucose isomerase